MTRSFPHLKAGHSPYMANGELIEFPFFIADDETDAGQFIHTFCYVFKRALIRLQWCNGAILYEEAGFVKPDSVVLLLK
jgi:hypothetical protein